MSVREINVSKIRDIVAELCVSANLNLPRDILKKIEESSLAEKSPICADVLRELIKNADCAKKIGVPICQDTGMTVIFLDIGQDVHFYGGDLYAAINQGVAKGYKDGFLRMSIVSDPLERRNTNDNTPAIIHTRIVGGDKVNITVAPKGFGSENMSKIKMFNPSVSADDIMEFIVDCVSAAGSNPCPPVVVGVGIGGDFEYSAELSKRALCRDIGEFNLNPVYRDLEEKTLTEINDLGIGAQGFGGTITALAVHIEQAATHIAGLPVAVNISCHVTRHQSAEI